MTEVSGLSIHPLLRAYAKKNHVGHDAFRADGVMCLVFDGRYRVLVRPFFDDQFVATSGLLDLTGVDLDSFENGLVRWLEFAATMVLNHASGPVIDESGDQLLLQQILIPTSEVDQLESGLADFVNSLAVWRSFLAAGAVGSISMLGPP